MIRGSVLLLLLTAANAAQAAPAPPDGPRRIPMTPRVPARPDGAFRYRLLPDPLDRKPGNAAPLWRLASDAYRDANHKLTNQEHDYWLGTPLQKLSRKDGHDLLSHYTAALRLARQAACRERCDWELPPLTLQSIQEYLPLSMVQRCRELATLLSIQYRLQLAEGRFEDAAETLQTGFALARHLCQSDMLIQHLVGIAIGAIMFGRVEEWIETPNSPNLYWALAALPRPFLDVRRSVECELNTLYRSFPALRRLRKETGTARQVEEQVKELFAFLSKMMGNLVGARQPNVGEDLRKLGESIRKAEGYEEARKHLLDQGRALKEVDAMPKIQVVLLWHLDQYDRARDNALKAMALPPWEGRPYMDRAEKELHNSGNPIFSLLAPALSKTYEAYLRSERQLAALRCAEALRLYAAAHGGKPPAKWSDIIDVPLPIDPVTGKGFDAFYELKDGRGVLEVPLSPSLENVASLRRRFELAPPR